MIHYGVLQRTSAQFSDYPSFERSAYLTSMHTLIVPSSIINKIFHMKNLYSLFPGTSAIIKIVILFVFLVFPVFVYAQTPVISGFTGLPYTERTSPVAIAPSVAITNGTSYTDGFLRFHFGTPTGVESLGMTSASDPTLAGAISLDGISVYLGQGAGSKVRIGEIDAIENGQNGNPLKINITFTRNFPNASFEDGLGSWAASSQYYYRMAELDGMEIPIRPADQCSGFTHGLIRIPATPSASFQVSQTTDQSPTDGLYCIRLYLSGTVPSAYGSDCRSAAYSIFGPTIVSTPFNAYTGDKFSVDWKAAAGGDWYDVIGYLLGSGGDRTWGTGDDTRVMMFAERGSYSPWVTSEITIPEDGEYKFEFVSGSYDRTGGTVLGATLYVDNLQLVSGAEVGVNDATLQSIARQVTYEYTGCEPPATQTVHLTAQSSSGNSGYAQGDITITGVNCPPSITSTSVNPSFVENGSPVNLYTNSDLVNIESGQAVVEFNFTVTNVSDGLSEIMNIDGTDVHLVDGTTGITFGNSIGYTVSVAGTTATVSFSSPSGISATEMELILDQISYHNTNGNPSGGNRVVSLEYIRDNGGIANGGSDESFLNINSTVEVKAAVKIALFAGNNQSGQVSSTLSAFTVLVTTADDIPVSGRVVSFNIDSAPDGSTGEVISATSESTDLTGQASVLLTLGSKAGNYSVSASSAGLAGTPVVFNAEGLPLGVSPEKSLFTVSTTDITAGGVVTATVTPLDQFDNLLGPGQSVTIQLDNSSSDINGLVAVTDNGDGTYSASFTVTSVTANNFITSSINGSLVSYNHDITVTPGAIDSFTIGSADSPHIYGDLQSVSVTAFDQYGNIKTNYEGTVEFSSDDVGATLPVDYTFSTADNGVATFTDEVLFSKAGTFEIRVTDTSLPSASGVQSGILVNRRGITVTAMDLIKAYGADNPDFEYYYSGFANGDDSTSLQVAPNPSTTVVKLTVVGTYINSIILSGGSDPRYDFTYVPASFEVTKAIITVTAEEKTKVYGSENPDLTFNYSGFIPGEDEGDLLSLPSVSTEITTSSSAGVYSDAITVTEGSAQNYEFFTIAGDMIITKAMLAVLPDDKQKSYGEENPLLTFSYSGFVLEDNETVIDNDPVAGTDAGQYSGTGAYDITLSGGVDDNYSFDYLTGTLTVIKADQTIDFSEIPSGMRITMEHLLTATSTSGLQVEFAVVTPETAAISGDYLRVTREGTVTVVATQSGDSNWNPAPAVSQSVTTLPTFDNVTSLFTPNGDGMNDYWYIPNLQEMGRVGVKVYNRFGKLVFETGSYSNDWDGTWNGNPLPSASYYYLIDSEVMGTIKGTVNIIR